MPFGPKKNSAEMKRISEEILKYRCHAISDISIAKKVGLPMSTYWRYVQKQDEDLRKRYLKKTNTIVAGYINRTMARIRLHHSRFADTQDDRSLNYAQRAEDSLADFLMKIGVLDKSPETIKLETTVLAYEAPNFGKDKKEADKNEKQKSVPQSMETGKS